ERLRAFYHRFTPDGDLPIKPYIAALTKHRDELKSGKSTPAQIAGREKINPKYFALLWSTLSKSTGEPMTSLSKRVLSASETEVDAVVGEIAALQKSAWKVVPVGSYRDNAASRQVADDSTAKTPEQKLGLAEFRKIFPLFLCLSNVIPTDEVVCL